VVKNPPLFRKTMITIACIFLIRRLSVLWFLCDTNTYTYYFGWLSLEWVMRIFTCVSLWVSAVGVGNTCKWIAGDWLCLVVTAERFQRQKKKKKQKKNVLSFLTSVIVINNHSGFWSTNAFSHWPCYNDTCDMPKSIISLSRDRIELLLIIIQKKIDHKCKNMFWFLKFG